MAAAGIEETKKTQVMSLFIGWVHHSINVGKVREVFSKLNWGEVGYINMLKKVDKKGHDYKTVFVNFTSWNDDEMDMFNQFMEDKEVTVEYDEKYHWNVRKVIRREKDEKFKLVQSKRPKKKIDIGNVTAIASGSATSSVKKTHKTSSKDADANVDLLKAEIEKYKMMVKSLNETVEGLREDKKRLLAETNQKNLVNNMIQEQLMQLTKEMTKMKMKDVGMTMGITPSALSGRVVKSSPSGGLTAALPMTPGASPCVSRRCDSPAYCPDSDVDDI